MVLLVILNRGIHNGAIDFCFLFAKQFNQSGVTLLHRFDALLHVGLVLPFNISEQVGHLLLFLLLCLHLGSIFGRVLFNETLDAGIQCGVFLAHLLVVRTGDVKHFLYIHTLEARPELLHVG